MIDISRQKQFFPLKSFKDVEQLFAFNIDETNGEPNLAVLSIVAGLIEHSLVTITDKDDLAANSRPVLHRRDEIQQKFGSNELVVSSSSSMSHNNHLSSTSNEIIKHDLLHLNRDSDSESSECNEADCISSDDSFKSSDISSSEIYATDDLPIPEVDFEVVEALFKKFVNQFKNSIELKDEELSKTNLKIKRISDSVWEHLSNSYYKDKAHLQSIFSYLTTSKLDCFGLAYAVIAGCQMLDLKDIYLALSEDHAWVMFDVLTDDQRAQKERESKEYLDMNQPVPSCALYGTCEVTWHGKANSDKRGQPVTYKNCWLYTNGYAVKCDIRLCVAAMVSSINPSINSNTDSEILALLQQRLLWLLYSHKSYYPMSLGNLGELENLCPTPEAPLTPLELFSLGIEISRNEYNDSHVYPYTYLASYFYNHGRFKEALETWSDASLVMTKYNYSRDDEEIYKEFFEVANELIPAMLKVLTAGGLEPGRISTKPFLQDPECLALILKFYDNICCWEEGSSTPVLHIGWAKNFVATMLKFNSIIRSKVKLMTEDEWNQTNEPKLTEEDVKPNSSIASDLSDSRQSTTGTVRTKQLPSSPQSVGSSKADKTNDSTTGEAQKTKGRKRTCSADDRVDSSENSRSKIKLEEANSTVASPTAESSVSSVTTQGCQVPIPRERRIELDSDGNVTLILKSRKIAGLRELLQAERINRTAIELQLTAQSQCAVRGRSNSSSHSWDFVPSSLIGGSTRSKRLHR